jgi:aspartyl-tRNA synthetase
MKWQEAMDRFGIDRPDTRFGLELVDITDAAKAVEFEPFRAAQTVRAIVVPGGASYSRKRIDDLTDPQGAHPLELIQQPRSHGYNGTKSPKRKAGPSLEGPAAREPIDILR